MSKRSRFVLVALRLPTVECDLLALLSDTQVWFVRVSLQETPRSGVSVATEPLGFHLQMKTTWPAVWVIWEPDGSRQAGRQGSLGQWPVVSFHFLLPPLPLTLVSWNARVVQD